MRERAVQARRFFGDDLAHRGFVIGVGPRVQEHHGDRFDVIGVQAPRGATGAVFIEDRHHVARRVETFDHFVRAMARHVGLGPLEEEVVRFGAASATDLVDVAHPFGHQQRGARAGAFDRGIDGDRRAVDDELGVARRPCRLGEGRRGDGGSVGSPFPAAERTGRRLEKDPRTRSRRPAPSAESTYPSGSSRCGTCNPKAQPSPRAPFSWCPRSGRARSRIPR